MVGVKSKLIVLAILLIAAFGYANAQLTHGTEYLDREGKEGDILHYLVTFQNNGDESLYISIFLAADMNPSHFTIDPGQTQDVDILYTIPYGTTPGTLFIKPILFDKDGVKYNYSVILDANILPTPGRAYKFSNVRLTDLRTEPSAIDPRNAFDIVFSLTNPTETEPTGTVSLISDFDFGALPIIKVLKGTNEYRISGLKLPDNSIGNLNYTLRIIMQDTYLDTKGVFNVPEFSTCTVTENAKSGLLGRTYSADVNNAGTGDAACTITSAISGLEKYLVDDRTAGYTYDGKTVSWQITVPAGQATTVGYKITYVPIIAIPFVIILAVIAVWYFTRKMEIKKELVDYRRHAGFMDLKLQVHVKNLTNGEMKNVKIYDFLPAFIKEIREFGTVPGTVTTKDRQKAVKWELEHLKPKEERIFSYKVRTSVEVLGNMNFPPTTVEYKDAKGVERQESSNVLTVEVE
ncbi:MAG: hypothetical protein PHC66_04960 [Candidatus Nanoarchaeia archaeon]|nr:hypothetical protein [Candidatus Nanoarchaeia archaeon]MDD5238898.1 hypothetical protein [Candidatus Nanoarchaeia archaeon]